MKWKLTQRIALAGSALLISYAAIAGIVNVFGHGHSIDPDIAYTYARQDATANCTAEGGTPSGNAINYSAWRDEQNVWQATAYQPCYFP